MDIYQEFIHQSRYARYLDDKGRRETWSETVDRYVNYLRSKVSLDASVFEEIRSGILNMEVMPSMRALMTAGPALDKENVAGFNCAYVAVNHVRAFDEAMYILMCGTGVGFSVERQEIAKLPVIAEEFEKSHTIIAVEDSRKGWAKAFRELLAMLWAGQVPSWDVSKVRPAGARLKTFGGRASGPGPLVDLFNFSVSLFQKAAGRKLTSIECHDLMCKVAEVVVAGGVRRSAMISLSNLSDDRMRDAKSGMWWESEPQRALANNSAVYTEKPDMSTFIEEWTALYKSKSGERGIFNREASKKKVAENERRDLGYDFGTNPCCVTGETLVLTDKGHIPIKDLVGKKVNVWNGEEFAEVEPYRTGVWPIYRVELSDGNYLNCTANHKFVTQDGYQSSPKMTMTKDLRLGQKLAKFPMPVVESGVEYEGDAYSQGFYSGDGSAGYETSWLYAPKYPCEKRLIGTFGPASSLYSRKSWRHGSMRPKNFVPVDGTSKYCVEWLAGLFDADGTVTRDINGNGIQLVSIDVDFLNDVRLMLSRLGVRAKVVHAASSEYRVMPDGRGGHKEYLCKETNRLLIGNTDVYHLLNNLDLSFSRLEVHNNPPQRDARQFVKITDIIDTGRQEDTYCFTEPKTSRGTFNGIVTGQSEIILRSAQFCNLSEVVCREDDTLEDLKRKIRLATIIGTIQSTFTDFKYLRKTWKENTEEERLLGVSLTGIMDCKFLRECDEYSLKELRDYAIGINKSYAIALGINPSTAITCVKPSGTVSALTNSSSGIHARHSAYYIRTVRGDVKDPLSRFMSDKGVPCEPCVVKPETTVVFSFPHKSPEGAITRNDMTAVEQLEFWLKFQRGWCEHKPSVTISVREHEWLEVGAWVYRHFDEMSGISFLPYSEHIYQQAPYQECSKGEYEELAAKMPKDIDWTEMSAYESGDNTKGSQTYACSAGVCEIVDLV